MWVDSLKLTRNLPAQRKTATPPGRINPVFYGWNERLARCSAISPLLSPFGVIRLLSPPEDNGPCPPIDGAGIILRRHQMAIESRNRNGNTRRSLSLLLAVIFVHLVSVDASAQSKSPSSLLSRLTSQRESGLKASFSFSPKFPKQGQAVQFLESSSGNPASWTWDFGDGTSSTERNPSHIYSAPGFRKVTLTVSTARTARE